MKLRESKWFVPGIILGALFVGALLGYGLNAAFGGPAFGCTSHYRYINPSPDCDTFDERALRLDNLQNALEAKTALLENQTGVTHISVFARDLVTRRFAGVDADRVYYLASLLKVPILVAYYSYAEVDQSILNDTITYDGSINDYERQGTDVPDHLTVGKTYSVSELLDHAIVNSDNTAAEILLARLPSAFVDKTLAALGIQFNKPEGDKENLVTARTYSNVLRVLYNSSYLSREYSDKALELLTKTSFRNAAAAGIPEGVAVAHKFGERTNVDATGAVVSRQLHDCGIVYAKAGAHPYIFCILTEGTDFTALENAIRDVSATIYNSLEQ